MHHEEVVRGPRLEPDCFVDADRADVLARDVQYRGLPTRFDAGRDRAYEARRQAALADGFVGTDGADLCVALEMHALTHHRDENAVFPQTEVRAELDGAREERAGSRASDEREHVGDVVVREPDEDGIGFPDLRGRDHLQPRKPERDIPLPGDVEIIAAEHDGRAAGPDQPAERDPRVTGGVVGHPGEGRDLRVVADRDAGAFAEWGVRTGQRVPYGVVERLHVRDGVMVTLAEASIFDHVERIDADGYTIVEDAIEPALVRDLCDTIRRLERELDVRPRETAAEGHATMRMYNLLAKDPLFQAMPVHRSVLPIVERMLDRGCLLSGMTAIDIGPGEHPQPMHGDDIVMSRHLQRPHAPMMVTSMWALTDFTPANGGTWFVPGSHRSPLSADAPGALDGAEVRALEMPAGAVMIFHGSLWHGGGANTTTDEWRLGVNVQYCPGFVRQQQNPYLGIPSEIAAGFSDRLLELLGYRLYKGIMGHIDGRSPGEVVFGDRMAETAYRDSERRGTRPMTGDVPLDR